MDTSELVNLRALGYPPHDDYVNGQMQVRSEAFALVEEPEELARYIGGHAEKPGIGEDWAVRKQVFPEVHIWFVYRGGDEEFPGNMQVLYSGQGMIEKIPGEDLANLTVACANHLVRYVRDRYRDRELPQICAVV